MLRSTYYWLIPVSLVLGACMDANSEQEQVRVTLAPLFYSGVFQPSGSQVLQGSDACFSFSLANIDDEFRPKRAEACFDITLAGGPVFEGHCVTLHELGTVQVDFTPRADCPFEELGELVADRFLLEVVPIEGLRAGLEWYMERSAERWLTRATALPADVIPAVGEPLRLVPGVEVAFPINVLDAPGERVGWDLSQGRVLEVRDDSAPRELAPVEYDDAMWPVSIGAGQQSTLSLAIAGAVLPVVEVVATPAEDAASLEIVAGYYDGPYGARAVVRDAEGRVILGAPVQWSLVEGELALGPFDGLVPPEYTVVLDECVPPPTTEEPRRAVLRAQLGDLSDELELEWTAMPPMTASDEPFEPSSGCVRGTEEPEEPEEEPEEPGEPAEDDGSGDSGCNCAAGAGDGREGLPWLMVVALAVGRRRLGRAG